MEFASPPLLPRRRLLVGIAATAAATLLGCRRAAASPPTLMAARGQLPKAWLRALPSPWQLRLLEDPAAVLNAATATATATATAIDSAPATATATQPDLVSLSDGWAQELAPHRLEPFGMPELLARLDPRAAAVSRLHAAPGSAPVAFPWAMGTWLLVLRNRSDLLARRDEGWGLLLDPSLRRQLVLPSSPRVVIELALRQLGLASARPGDLEDSRLVPQLRALRRQALAFDERDGLNLLLAGEAQAAVLPSQRVLPLLARDSRLAALLPATGSPLQWQLLLRPASRSGFRSEALPSLQGWLAKALESPLIDRLLAAGLLPPLPRTVLAASLARWPEEVRSLLLPPQAVLEHCNDLVPLAEAERRLWQRCWDAAAPGPQQLP